MEKELDRLYNLVPQALHQEIDTLLFYVINYPYQRPEKCPYCSNRKISKRNKMNAIGGSYYHCAHCYRDFSQLTGSYFAKTNHINKWPDYIRLRFSGTSLNTIAKQLHLSKKTAINRDRTLQKILHDKFPSLYTWWSSHQKRRGRRLLSLLDSEKEIFLNGLKDLAQTKSIICPSCGTKMQRFKGKTAERPIFYCRKCKTTINLLKDTTLYRVKNLARWLEFAELVFNRKSSQVTEKQLGFSHIMTSWRNRFIEQASAMKLNALVKWLK